MTHSIALALNNPTKIYGLFLSSLYLYQMNDMKSTGEAQTLSRNTFSLVGVYPA